MGTKMTTNNPQCLVYRMWLHMFWTKHDVGCRLDPYNLKTNAFLGGYFDARNVLRYVLWSAKHHHTEMLPMPLHTACPCARPWRRVIQKPDNRQEMRHAQRAGNQMGISDIIWHDRWELIWLSQYEPITVDIIWQTTRSIHLLSPFLGLVGNESVSIGHSTHHIKTQAAHFTSGTLTVRTHDLSCRENCHVYGRVDRRKCTTDWWVFEDHLPKYVWLRIQK